MANHLQETVTLVNTGIIRVQKIQIGTSVSKQCLLTELDPDVPGAEAGLIDHLIKVHRQSSLFCHNLFAKQGELEKHQKKCYKRRLQPDLVIVD